MWSGHLGLALTEGVETFAERHPEGHLFHRAHEHQQLVADIRQRASQKGEPQSASLLETGHTASATMMSSAEMVQGARAFSEVADNGALAARCEGGVDRAPRAPASHGNGLYLGRSGQHCIMEAFDASRDVGARSGSGSGCGGRVEDSGCPPELSKGVDESVFSSSFSAIGHGVGKGTVGAIDQLSRGATQGVSTSGPSPQGQQTCEMVGMQAMPSAFPKVGNRELDPSGLKATKGTKALGQQTRWSRKPRTRRQRVDKTALLSIAEAMQDETVVPSHDEQLMLDAAYLQLVPSMRIVARSTHAGDMGDVCKYYGHESSTGALVDSSVLPCVSWTGIVVRVDDTMGSVSEGKQGTVLPTACEVQELWRMIQIGQVTRYDVPQGEIIVHGPQPKLQVLDVLISHKSHPYRVSVLRTPSGMPQVDMDLWVSQGRRKRERNVGEGSHVVATLFVHECDLACAWKSQLDVHAPSCVCDGIVLDLANVSLPQLHVKPSDEGHEVASWQWEQLLHEVYVCLQRCPFERATGRTNVTDGQLGLHLPSVTVGLTTARGSMVTSRSSHPAWKHVLPLLHELAQRRPPDLQHPYLAITVSCGCASKHVDKNVGVSCLLALGPFTHGGGLVIEAVSGRQREIHCEKGQTSVDCLRRDTASQ
eukprot:5451890-Amphidinium_carterae.1